MVKYLMGITIIDQSPELYWFVSNALLQDEIPLKHLQSIEAGEQNILNDLPEIVILNGDDSTILPDQFINKMRNHVFARNTLFIVVTSNTSNEFKKLLLVAGAAQILYRGRGFGPSPKFLASLIKWFLNTKSPDAQIFDYKPIPFPAEAEFTTFGRIGWLSSSQCLIETNADLMPGQSIDIKSPIFDDLDIKNIKVQCIEKNQVGRYYQYANSLLCQLLTKESVKDVKKLDAWIQNNKSISKHKSIKVVYFENDPDYRLQIKEMIKADTRYCARGYSQLKDFLEVLNYQLPQLILIDRALIQEDKASFEVLKKFVKDHFCYCVTYAHNDFLDIEEFKKTYPFAMHSPTPINLSLLESMIDKLKQKMPDENFSKDPKIYFNKHSPYSRISLPSTCKLTELGLNGIGILLPIALSNYCACEISSNAFITGFMGRTQYFRSFLNKPSNDVSKGIYHRMIFIGQNTKDNKLVKDAIECIEEIGFEKWLNEDDDDNETSNKKKT
jgi:hypothetical protein